MLFSAPVYRLGEVVLGGGGGLEDLGLNKVTFSRSPFQYYFTEVIPPNNF